MKQSFGRRPFVVNQPLRAQTTGIAAKLVIVPATAGVCIFAEPEQQEEYGRVEFTWGATMLVAELSMFRDATKDILGPPKPSTSMK